MSPVLAKLVAIGLNLNLICVAIAALALLDLTSITISRLNLLERHPQKSYFGLALRSTLASVAAFASRA